MAILVDENTKLVVQGLTGREGSFHGLRNREYGTDLVAGVTPGKGGQDVEGVPVFDTVHEAVAETGANTSMVFVPPPFAADAIYEAADAGIETIICITEGIPAHDMLRRLQLPPGHRLAPDRARTARACCRRARRTSGIIPAALLLRGRRRAACRAPARSPTRSATSWPSSASATRRSSASAATRSSGQLVHRRDRAASSRTTETELIVMVGEIGGDEEERTAEYIGEHVTKPVVAYIAGFTAPPGKRMGHAGAIISGSSGHRAGEGRGARGEGRAGRDATRPRRRSMAAERVGAKALSRSRLYPHVPMSSPGLISFARGRSEPRHHARRGAARGRRPRAARGPRGRAGVRAGSGYAPLREWIAERHGVEPERVLVANGSLEAGMHAVRPPGRARRPGGRRGAVLRPHAARRCSERGAELTAVPLEDDGIDVGALERRAGRRPAAELHRTSIPNFHNPAGCTLSLAKRERLLELAAEHDFVIFEDDPYGELRFEGEDLPTMLSLDTRRAASCYASSFSKTIAPGVRVGYLIGPPTLIAAITTLAVNTYISPNMLAQAIVGEFCRSGAIDDSIATRQAGAARAPRRAGRGARPRTSATRPRSWRPRAATSCGSSCREEVDTRAAAGGRRRARGDVREGPRLHARGRAQRPAARLLGGHAGAGRRGRAAPRRGARRAHQGRRLR